MAILSSEEILAIVLFLVLSLIFIFTVLALLRDGLRTTTNRLMLAFITLMYLASAATFCVEITTLSRLLKELEQEDPAHEYMDYRFQSSSMRTFLLDDFLGVLINAIFGDGIILWRVLAIWPRSKLAKRVSIALYILLVASSLAGIICLFALPTAPTYLVFLGISLVSNLWATTMIGIRAWQFRKMLRRQVTIISRKSVLEKALILLVESGIVYCVLWAAYFVLFLCLQFGTYYDFLLSYIQMYFSIILWFFVPMYPMLIVLLVSRRKSVLEDHTLTSIEAVTKLDLADNSVEYAELGNRSNEPHWTSEPFLEYKYEEILPSLARPTP